MVVPLDWMPDCKMDRIITHWTAGVYKPNKGEFAHYHILIDGDGTLHRGDHSIKGNAAGAKGDRASHTKNCNTGSIGITVCCMQMPDTKTPLSQSAYPMKRVQWNMLAYVAGTLAMQYGIPCDQWHILGHGEVQENLGIAQAGKVDPLYLSWHPSLDLKTIGAMFRLNVRTYIAERSARTTPWLDPKRPPYIWV
jgi:N-acetyl-anhydromuramyl-L-alanine amidase AmpD